MPQLPQLFRGTLQALSLFLLLCLFRWDLRREKAREQEPPETLKEQQTTQQSQQQQLQQQQQQHPPDEQQAPPKEQENPGIVPSIDPLALEASAAAIAAAESSLPKAFVDQLQQHRMSPLRR